MTIAVRAWFTVLFVILAESATWATPIAYDESIDGPLPTKATPGVPGGPTLSDFLTLDVGQNVASGTARFGSLGSTFDNLPVILPSGLTIASVTLTVSNLRSSGPLAQLDSVRAGLLSYDAAVTEILFGIADENEVQVPVLDTPVLTGQFPLAVPGNFGITFAVYSGSLFQPDFVDFDYSWKINVVPEPSTALLVALGCGGLAAARKPKRVGDSAGAKLEEEKSRQLG